MVIFGYLKQDSGLLNWLKIKKSDEKYLDYFIEEKRYCVRKLGYEVFSEVRNDNSCLLIFGN